MARNQPSSDRNPRVAVDWEMDDAIEGATDRPFLEKVLAEALRGRQVGDEVQVGLTVTTDEQIRELNRTYRDRNESTDVLSFPLLEYERPEMPRHRFPLPPNEPLALGDVVISFHRAQDQAAAYGHSLERELAFLLVHGIMHLLGYDHEDPTDQEAMRVEEERVLARLGLTR